VLAIDLLGVSKGFELTEGGLPGIGTLKSWLSDVVSRRRKRAVFHPVLEGVDLGVRRGEALGIIGRNGCGKSTLLRLIARVYRPDRGVVRTSGKVVPILSLGGGFHPEFTGRENVLIEGMMLGLSRRDVANKFEAIADFAELGEYMDQPLRIYSTGMQMRLAFSVAVQVEPDVLLLDEILAVGDEAFRAKCKRRMEELKAQGVTILLVSHDLGSVRAFCDRVVWLDEGRIREEGPPGEVVASFQRALTAAAPAPAHVR